MSMSGTQNLELKQILENTVETVIENYSSSVKGKFVIGKALNEAKPSDNSSDEDKKAYQDIFSKLPFGEAVGDKFIRIYNTDYLREVAESELATNLPEGYNTLYSLTRKEIVNDKRVVDYLKKGFTNGKFKMGKNTDQVVSSDVSASKVTELINFVRKHKPPVNDFDMTVATIKIKSKVFSTDLVKIMKLQKALENLVVDGGEVKVSETNISKLEKSALKVQKDKLLAEAETAMEIEMSEAA